MGFVRTTKKLMRFFGVLQKENTSRTCLALELLCESQQNKNKYTQSEEHFLVYVQNMKTSTEFSFYF